MIRYIPLIPINIKKNMLWRYIVAPMHPMNPRKGNAMYHMNSVCRCVWYWLSWKRTAPLKKLLTLSVCFFISSMSSVVVLIVKVVLLITKECRVLLNIYIYVYNK